MYYMNGHAGDIPRLTPAVPDFFRGKEVEVVATGNSGMNVVDLKSNKGELLHSCTIFLILDFGFRFGTATVYVLRNGEVYYTGYMGDHGGQQVCFLSSNMGSSLLDNQAFLCNNMFRLTGSSQSS